MTAMFPAVNADLIEQFEREGYVKIPGVLTPDEAEALRHVVLGELAAYRRGERDSHPGYQAWETSALNISNLWQVVGALGDLSPHRRIARLAADLLRVPALRLYHDSLIFKRAGLPHGPWHQDRTYSLIEEVVTGWMPLVPIEEEDGALIYACGSHHDGLVDVAGWTQARIGAHLGDRGYVQRRIAMQPGDVVFHTGTVFHRSDATRGEDRPAFAAFLFRDGVRLRELPFGRVIDDHLAFFPGCGVGDIAESRLNPRLDPRPRVAAP